MPFDPNDADQQKAIRDAVQARETELQEEHDVEIQGLKDKNKQLLDRIGKLRRGGGDENTAAEITRLEGELEETRTKLSAAESEARDTKRSLTRGTGERDTAVTERDTERQRANEGTIDSDLTAALGEHRIAPEFTDAAKALLGKGATVREVDGKRKAFVGDKSLGDIVKEFAESDKGKAFVRAADNNGGNSGGNNNPALGAGDKRIDEMNGTERTAHYHKVGQKAFDEQVVNERANPKKKS